MTTQRLSPDRIMQLGFGFWGSRAFLSAIELRLFTALAKETLDSEALRERVGIHERSARDFFDALVALGVLARTDGKYANTPEADAFLDRNKPAYIGGIFEMAASRLFLVWAGLTEGLRTGRPQNEFKDGKDIFEELYSDEARLREFLGAMTGVSKGPAMAIAQKFPWQDHKTFFDIGTAQGALPVAVARANGHLSGGGFDLPPVEPIFKEYVGAAGLEDRVRFERGDFFKDPLPKADVLVFGHILHDWDVDTKRMLVRKAHDALPEGGAVIVYGAFIDDDRSKNAMGLLMSLNMLVETPGGFDYTGADCCGWLEEAGFRDTRVEHLAGPVSMAVGIKRA